MISTSPQTNRAGKTSGLTRHFFFSRRSMERPFGSVLSRGRISAIEGLKFGDRLQFSQSTVNSNTDTAIVCHNKTSRSRWVILDKCARWERAKEPENEEVAARRCEEESSKDCYPADTEKNSNH